LPKFDRSIPTCVLPADPSARDASRPVMQLDFDTHYADAWDTWAPQYLQAVAAGKLPYVATAGTNTTSANCPLLAVGGGEWSGHGPLEFLNAEFDTVEVQEIDGGPWRPIAPGETIACKRGAPLKCRASLGNTGEATWLAGKLDPHSSDYDARAKQRTSRLFLNCCLQDAKREATGDLPCWRTADFAADMPYLANAQSEEFTVPSPGNPTEEELVTLNLVLSRKNVQGEEQVIPFGQRWQFKIHFIP
jgi:hypothetical protein